MSAHDNPHKRCGLYRAVNGQAIECEHGYDVCPTCDPCTCEEERKRDIDIAAGAA